MTFYSPTGSEIIGTLELIPGIARISGIDASGAPEYEGYTDLDWDGQKTATKDGKLIFVDENGDEWTFDQLTTKTE